MPNVTKATWSMQVPTTRKGGATLSRADLKHLRLYRQGPTDTTGVLIATIDQPLAADGVTAGTFPDVVTYVDTTIASGTAYDCWFRGVDENGSEGDDSNHWPLNVPVPESAPAGGALTIALS